MPREEEEGFGAVDGPLVEEEVFSSVSTSGNMNAEAFAAISIEALVADDHATAVAFVAQDGRDTVATDKSDEMLIAHAFTVEETSAAPSGDSAGISNDRMVLIVLISNILQRSLSPLLSMS